MTHKEISAQTKAELAAALRKKMEVKPLKTISVRELALDCCLDRHTFYYHFRDIYGLVEWMYQQDGQRMMERLKETGDWAGCLRGIVEYLRDNRASCLCAMNSIHSEYFDRMLFDVVRAMQAMVLAEAARDCELSADRERGEGLDRFYTAAYAGIFKSYLRGEFQMPDEVFLERLEVMQRDHLRGAEGRLRKTE